MWPMPMAARAVLFWWCNYLANASEEVPATAFLQFWPLPVAICLCWVELPECGFQLMFYSNHRPKMHCCWAMGIGQTDGLQYCSLGREHNNQLHKVSLTLWHIRETRWCLYASRTADLLHWQHHQTSSQVGSYTCRHKIITHNNTRCLSKL